MPIVYPAETTWRTFLELQDEVLAHGFNASRYRPRVKEWLNDAAGRFLRRVEIPARLGSATITTVAGQREYDLPTNMVRVETVRRAGSDPDEHLLSAPFAELDAAGDTRGQPSRYALTGTKLLLHPTPSGVETLTLRMWGLPARMVADIDPSPLEPEYDELLIEYALSRAYRAEDDPEMATFHWQQYEREFARAKFEIENRDPNEVRQVPGMFAVWGAGVDLDGMQRP